MRPVRKSSEGPEVVLSGEGPEADKYFVPYRERIQKATGSQYQKQLDDRIPTPVFPPPPLAFEPPPHIPQPYSRRRTCGLVTTILIAVVAFLIGGGIGGGVGGALVVNDQAKISSLSSSLAVQPTMTVSVAVPNQTNCVVDPAGCPNINNKTYTYTSSAASTSFLQLCYTEIAAPAGQNIDISNSTTASLDACLDNCARYNLNVKQGGCQAATWVIFSTSNPQNNNVCFLKNSTGVPTVHTNSESVCSGLLTES